MPELSIDLIIAVTADRVWEVIGRRFDRIGDWATAITHSTGVPNAPAAAGSSAPPTVAAVPDAPPPAGSARPASGSSRRSPRP